MIMIPSPPLFACPLPRLQLLQDEIVDETDMFIDNMQTSRVNAATTGTLPPRLRAMVDRGAFTPR